MQGNDHVRRPEPEQQGPDRGFPPLKDRLVAAQRAASESLGGEPESVSSRGSAGGGRTASIKSSLRWSAWVTRPSGKTFGRGDKQRRGCVSARTGLVISPMTWA